MQSELNDISEENVTHKLNKEQERSRKIAAKKFNVSEWKVREVGGRSGPSHRRF